jgi:hypothetical protein
MEAFLCAAPAKLGAKADLGLALKVLFAFAGD